MADPLILNPSSPDVFRLPFGAPPVRAIIAMDAKPPKKRGKDVILRPVHPKVITRNDAKALGRKRYFTGKPCVHGHIAERLTSNGNCSICLTARCNLWEKKHPQWRRSYIVEYYSTNKEKIKKDVAIWNRNNRDKKSANQARRRAKQKGASGTYSVRDVERLLRLQKNRCAHAWCLKSLKVGYHVDHVKALSRGGSNDFKNLQILCERCNLMKGSKDPIAFAQANGSLL